MRTHAGHNLQFVIACALVVASSGMGDVIPASGPLAGGNSVVVTNAGTLGSGGDITNILVGGQSAAAAGQGADWVSFLAPASLRADVVDVVVQSTSVGNSSFGGAYVYNPRGRIFGPGLRNPAIAGGVYHTAALKKDGSVVCWGLNNSLQCRVPEPNADFVAVSAGWYHSMGLKSNGTVVCWGDNTFGQCSVPDTNVRFAAISAGESHSLGLTTNGSIVSWGGIGVVPGSNTDFVAIEGGGTHAAALKSNGTLVCWGDNSSGQCNIPAPNTNFVAVVAAFKHTLALRSDGSTVSWGDVTNAPVSNSNFVQIGASDSGNIGLKTDGSVVLWGASTNIPAGVSNVVALTAGALHDIVLRSDGSLVCWGETNNGQCAIVPPNENYGERGGVVPAGCPVTGGWPIVIYGSNLCASSDCTNVTLAGISVSSIVDQGPSQISVIAGASGSSVTGDVRIYSVSRGETIRANAFAYATPGMDVVGVSGAVIASGESPNAGKGTILWAPAGGTLSHRLTISNANATPLSIVSWTTNGDPGFSITGVPAGVEGYGASNIWIRYQPVAPGAYTTVVVIANDSPQVSYTVNLQGISFNLSTNTGPFAGGNTLTVTNVLLGNGSDITNVTVGGFAAVITGQGTNWVSFTVPTSFLPVTVDVTIQSASAGVTVLESAYRYNPVGRIFGPGCRDYALAAGTNHSVGLKSDGTVICWGSNTFGQCTVPAPNTNFTAVAAGLSHTLGLKRDGSVVCWGLNSNGQCNVPAPNTNFVAIAGGPNYSLGLKADGAIVYWGSTTSLARLLPVANTNFIAIAAGDNHGVGLLSNGQVVCWGANNNGQWNLPATNSNFVQIAAGNTYCVALRASGSLAIWGSGIGVLFETNVVSITARSDNCLELLADGNFVCAWGTSFRICDFSGGPPATSLKMVAGARHALAYMPDSSLWCWGLGSTNVRTVPAPNANFGEGRGVSPSSGFAAGGYPVTITGTNLCNGDVTNVTLAGIAASILSQSATQVVVLAGSAPDGTSGAVRVSSASYGVIVQSNAFTYIASEIAIKNFYGLLLTNDEAASASKGTALQMVTGSARTNRFTITNTGPNSLTLAWTTNGAGASSFSVVGMPSSVAAGTASNFGIAFTPASAGVRTATVTIVNNSTNSPYIIRLLGTGIQSVASITVSNYASLQQALDTVADGGTITITSAIQSITITNHLDFTYGQTAFVIDRQIRIRGSFQVLKRPDGCRCGRLFLVSGAGRLILENVAFQGCGAIGGRGGWNYLGYAGGGGAGLGGVIFNQGRVTLANVTFEGNVAMGGDSYGNLPGGFGTGGGSGGGGLGGWGREGSETNGGGGGGNRATANASTGGVDSGGNGATDSAGAVAGGLGGGGGGGGRSPPNQDGADGGFGGGGGGGGDNGFEAGAGGHGGFGGGGGAGFGGGSGGYGGGSFGGGGAGMGGAIFNDTGATLVMTNCTFINNSAISGTGTTMGTRSGAAIFNRDGTVVMVNCTAYSNSGYGVLFSYAESNVPSVTIVNTIMANTTDATSPWDCVFDGTNQVIVASNNLIRMSFNFPAGGIIVTSDPALRVTNFLGTTVLIPRATSPVINAGATYLAPANDQRGVARVDLPDLGAIELQWFNLLASNGIHGAVNPSGVVVVAEGETTGIVVSADTFFHIGSLLTNSVSVAAATGMVVFTSQWQSVSSSGTLYATFAPDVTSNQVPLWWMAGYGITSGFEAASTSDVDGDGQITLDEFVAGTDPTNQLIYFKLADVETILTNCAPDCEVAGYNLRWSSASGRVYSIYASSNAAGGVWNVIDASVTSTPPVNTYTLPPLTNQVGRFLIRARLP